MPSGSSSVTGKYLPTPLRERELVASKMANLGGHRMNPGKGFKCQRPSRRADERVCSGQLLVLKMGNYPRRQMNHKMANGIRCGKETRINHIIIFP